MSSKNFTKFLEQSKKLKNVLKGSSHFTCPKNELFLGIFHTTPIIDIHMILSGLNKSSLKVYEEKILFILHNFYIKNRSIFLTPSKKGMAAVFFQIRIIWNTRFETI